MPHSRLLSRRHWLSLSATAALGVQLHAQTSQTPTSSAPPPKPEPLPPNLVRDFVGKAHTQFDATRALLAQHPALLNATWDWGGGDFETGLGGASHMGSRDIAEFLIGQGARMDLFTAVMLGRLDIVTPTLSAVAAIAWAAWLQPAPSRTQWRRTGTTGARLSPAPRRILIRPSSFVPCPSSLILCNNPPMPPLSRRAALELLGVGMAGYALPDLAAAALVAGKTRVARIDVFPVRYPMQGRFKFFEGPEGSPTGRPAVLVRITDDLGGMGWGESVPIPKWSDETLETATTTIERYLAPELIGRDPADVAGAHVVMNRAIAPAFSTGQPIAKSGLDLALHDLVARRLGHNVAALWGRTPGAPLALSWTVNPRTLDEVESLVAAGRAKGYRHFNVKVAPDPKVDLELCRLVRAAAPDGFLWADANCGYDVETALAIAPKFADLGVAVFEAPLRPNRIAGYQALRRQHALPILMDEGIVSPDELAEFIHLGMLDGVAMKHARCGGLLAARRQIEMLLDAGLMWLGSGLTDPDVSLAATLALYGSFGQTRPCALNGPQFLAASVIDAPFTPKDGMLAPPTGPGLGVTVNEAKLRAIAEARSR